MKNAFVSDTFTSMYEDYYNRDLKTLKKRELTSLEVMEHIRQVYDPGHIERLLDVGAGEGSLLQCLGRSNFADELYGVEISQSGIDSIISKKILNLVEVKKFDGYSIPYPDKFFDLVVSSHVLEHVEHERLFLKELNRVAKNVIIEVPLEHTFRIKKSIKSSSLYGHINFYTPETLLNLLETSGLTLQKCEVISYSSKFEVFLYGPLKGLIKSAIRNLILKVSPKIATHLMVYFCVVHCSSNASDNIDL